MTTLRMFVTDLDGTVLGPDLTLSPRTRQAFAALASRGCRAVIATGRMLEAARPFADELGLTTPLITYNGAWVRCLESETDLLHEAVPAETAAQVVAALEQAGLHVNLYRDDRVYMRQRTPEAEAYVAHARVEPVYCGDWSELGACAPTKILAIGPEPHVVSVLAALQERFAGRLWMTQSMPTFLEIAHPCVNKGAAVAHLAARWGLEAAAVAAVGDGLNDVEMLAWAGLGVAMGNAHPELKRRADRVTGSVEADGVATLIESLIAEGRV
ncbi:MAG TPA: Cof-type HAD-IIB family hydrolase [Stenomitos sp.]